MDHRLTLDHGDLMIDFALTPRSMSYGRVCDSFDIVWVEKHTFAPARSGWVNCSIELSEFRELFEIARQA